MSTKQITVIAPGGDVRAHVSIGPRTTPPELLETLGLGRQYFLASGDGQSFFMPDDVLDAHLEDGATVHVALRADVGAGGHPALLVASLVAIMVGVAGLVTGLLIVLVREVGRANPPGGHDGPFAPASAATPGPSRAWRRSGDRFVGTYDAGVLRLSGRAEFRSPQQCRFEILAPETLIAACGPHRSCFLPMGDRRAGGQRWYEVHFRQRPETLAADILAIEEAVRAAACAAEGQKP